MHLGMSNSLVRLRPTVFALAVLGFTTALSAQAYDVASHVQKIAGCYATHLGDWSGPLPPNGLPTAHTPPAQFQLDTLPVRLGSAAFAVQPPRLVEHSHMVASWALLPSDSIRMFWSTGFVGVSLRLGVRGDSLVGTATAFHDEHYPGEPPDPTVSVVATRIDCPSR